MSVYEIVFGVILVAVSLFIIVFTLAQESKSQIEFFLDELAKSKELVTEFSTGLWNTVVDSVTVYSRSKVVFRFKDGTEVTWKIVQL